MAQVLNKRKGAFSENDKTLLLAMTAQGTLALQRAQFIERINAIRKQELEFLEVVSEVTSDIKIGSLLQKVMSEATRMLNAERSTLFLNDEKSRMLWSEIGQGLDAMQIRMPNHVGIAGAVFTSGTTINIPTHMPISDSIRLSTRRQVSLRAPSCARPSSISAAAS